MRSHRVLPVLLSFFTMVTLLSPIAQAAEPLRLVFITCCRDEAFFDPVKKGMNDAAKMMNVSCEFIGTPGVDVKAQAEMVRKAVADGYHGIALNIIDPAAFNEVVAEAMKKGVPVVAFNTDARPPRDAPQTTANTRLSSVGQDYTAAGRALATRALEFIPPGSKVLVTQHDVGVASLDMRLAGIREVLEARKISLKVICSGNEPAKATDVIAAELKTNPEIHHILGTGQTDTEAAGRAIERDFAGKGYASAGFDLSPEILRLLKANIIRFTTDQQPYIQGYYPVIQLALYRRYGIVPSSIDAGAGIITKDDVDRVSELKNQKYR